MFLEVKGVQVRYEMLGERGSRVVLLHGWGCTSELMERTGRALEPDHRVLMIDFPGHGKSGKPPEPWGVPEYAACLRGLLEKMDFLPCAAVAHSFGCRVAAWSASEWPDMFTRMVFTGAAGLKAPQTEEGKRRADAYRRKKDILRKLRSVPPLKGLSLNLEEKLRRKYGSADYIALDEDMRGTFVKVVQQDLRNRYPMIRQSTLLIWGDADTETPLWMGKEMEKLIPDAGLVILEGGSHFAYLEQAERFNTIVRHFLTEA